MDESGVAAASLTRGLAAASAAAHPTPGHIRSAAREDDDPEVGKGKRENLKTQNTIENRKKATACTENNNLTPALSNPHTLITPAGSIHQRPATHRVFSECASHLRQRDAKTLGRATQHERRSTRKEEGESCEQAKMVASASKCERRHADRGRIYSKQHKSNSTLATTRTHTRRLPQYALDSTQHG